MLVERVHTFFEAPLNGTPNLAPFVAPKFAPALERRMLPNRWYYVSSVAKQNDLWQDQLLLSGPTFERVAKSLLTVCSVLTSGRLSFREVEMGGRMHQVAKPQQCALRVWWVMWSDQAKNEGSYHISHCTCSSERFHLPKIFKGHAKIYQWLMFVVTI